MKVFLLASALALTATAFEVPQLSKLHYDSELKRVHTDNSQSGKVGNGIT